MNKKTLIIVAVVALAVGGIGSIALQSHAQNTANQSVVAPAVTVAPSQENTASDGDNIQNDVGGVDKPDAVVQQDTETNDGSNTAVGNDTKEQGDQATPGSDPEVEDGN